MQLALGIFIMTLGYAVSLLGASYLMRMPLLYATGLMMTGILITTTIPNRIDERLRFPNRSRTLTLSYLFGSLVILSFLFVFADEIAKWTKIHPASFPIMWFILANALSHILESLVRIRQKPTEQDLPVLDYSEEHATNPYAPLIRAKPVDYKTPS